MRSHSSRTVAGDTSVERQRRQAIEGRAGIGDDLRAGGRQRDGIKDRQRDSGHGRDSTEGRPTRPHKRVLCWGSLPVRKDLQLMRRAIACTTLALLASAIVVASAPQKTDGPSAGGGVVVRLRGCVSGSLLKSVVADSDVGRPDRWRRATATAWSARRQSRRRSRRPTRPSSRSTGRITPGPQSVVKGTKMGGTSIGIGVAPGSGTMGQQAPYTPTIEVDEIEVRRKGL